MTLSKHAHYLNDFLEEFDAIEGDYMILIGAVSSPDGMPTKLLVRLGGGDTSMAFIPLAAALTTAVRKSGVLACSFPVPGQGSVSVAVNPDLTLVDGEEP